MHHFDDDNGAEPSGSLTVLGGKLYGMTTYGGDDGDGVIFEYDPANTGNEYSVLHHFYDDNGEAPRGSLTESGGKLYGMTEIGGGDAEVGVLFEYDPGGAGYSVVLNFDGSNGAEPRYGHLIVIGNCTPTTETCNGVDDDCDGDIDEDDTAPTALCKNISIALDALGTAILTASQIDGGSTDVYCAGPGTLAFAASPNTFDCDDTGGGHTVTLTVTDAAGNTSNGHRHDT